MPKTSKLNLEAMEEQCMRLIEESGARLEMKTTGVHYRLSSGCHSEIFFNMARVFERYSVRNYLAQFFLRKIKNGGIDPRSIDVLIGPATGALPLLYTLQNFPDFEHTRVMYAERDREGKFMLGKGFEIRDNEQIFILDDVGTTFKSLRAVQKIVESSNGCLRGVGVLIDRSPNEKRDEHITAGACSFAYICGIRVPEVYIEKNCPHCKEGIPVVKV